MSKKNLVIVGAGPAGLFAAHEASKNKNLKITVVEMGPDVQDRGKKDYLHGVGGGGTFSDGKLNLDPEIGGDMTQFMPRDEALEYIAYIEKVFLDHGAGAKGGESVVDSKAIGLKRKAKKAGVKYIPIHQRHIGSDHLPEVISSIKKEMEERGVKFVLNTAAEDIIINGEKVTGVRLAGGEELPADYVIIGSGRGGAKWFMSLCSRHKIPTKFQALDVGVRVEVPNEVMEEITAISWDPKFHIQTKQYDDFVRTFCTNPSGYVVAENYGDFICVNGHSLRDKHSENTNFAFLVQIALTEPVENTTEYGESIARLATTIGGGKPTIQRLGDLKSGRRSTWERIRKSYVPPTLKNATPGDISMILPGRIVTDLLEGLDALDAVIPGVAADSTLLYAPEIKFHALRVDVSKKMETKIKNLFAAGDGAGVSRGIVGAAVTGLVAAKEISERSK